MGWNVTTFLKKSNAALPVSVCGKAVKGVPRGQEIIEVRKIPIRIAPLTRYIMRKTVRKLNMQFSACIDESVWGLTRQQRCRATS